MCIFRNKPINYNFRKIESILIPFDDNNEARKYGDLKTEKCDHKFEFVDIIVVDDNNVDMDQQQ